MNSNTSAARYTILQAAAWNGRKVKTTDNVTGVVSHAYPSGRGDKLILHVWTGHYSLVTDNEHATLVKTGE